MNNFNYYILYGLTIKSQIPLHSSLITESKVFDVTIATGIIHKENQDNCISMRQFKLKDNYAYFTIPDVASYEISNGNNILIEINPNANELQVKNYLLGSSFGFLLLQRGIIALHGGALVIGENGVVISGNIGSGKTTTIAGLVENGHRFLSDDVSSITKDSEGIFLLNSCIPQQKMSRETLNKFNYNINTLQLIDKNKDKYLSPEISSFSNIKLPIKYVFYLDVHEEPNVEYQLVSGVEKFNLIFNNIFRKEYIPKILIKPEYVKDCINLANSLTIYKITRPKNKDSLKDIISTIEYLSTIII